MSANPVLFCELDDERTERTVYVVRGNGVNKTDAYSPDCGGGFHNNRQKALHKARLRGPPTRRSHAYPQRRRD